MQVQISQKRRDRDKRPFFSSPKLNNRHTTSVILQETGLSAMPERHLLPPGNSRNIYTCFFKDFSFKAKIHKRLERHYIYRYQKNSRRNCQHNQIDDPAASLSIIFHIQKLAIKIQTVSYWQRKTWTDTLSVSEVSPNTHCQTCKSPRLPA